jgi:hypothetical protein
VQGERNTMALMLKTTTMRQFFILILIVISISLHGQTREMDTLVKSLRENLKYDFFTKNKSKEVKQSIIYEGDNFNVRISDTLIEFNKKEIVLPGPNMDNPYPRSYSVIYKDNIVSLFDKHGFICHKLSDYTRNFELEKILNTKQFAYDWLIDNNLYGYSNGKFWILDKSGRWKKSDLKLPFEKKPKLFNDDKYIVFCDCHGEWGGTVYFYNRLNQNTYFTEATCANSVIKRENGYNVLSQIGHMMGGTDLKFISDPGKLSNLKDFSGDTKSVNALGYSDKSNQAIKIFDFNGIEIFSSFQWNNVLFYIVNWQQKTFIAKIDKNNFIIVDPLFNNNFYTHNPITNVYENGVVLMNMDLYLIAREREISMIIIKDKELTKIDWHEKH